MGVSDLRARLRGAVEEEVAGFDAAVFDALTKRLAYVRGS